MRLVYRDNGNEVKIGDIIYLDGDGREEDECVKVMSIEKPHKPSSTGRVYVQQSGFSMQRSYFPSVIGAEWIEREDHVNF